jgi:membrane protease YdiL (CAAX protease family)
MPDAAADHPVPRQPGTPRASLLALLLLVPIPSLGTAMAMIARPGPVGQAVFATCKVWLVVFPVAWYLLVDRGRPSLSPPRQGGLGVGAALGAAVGAIIAVAYIFIGIPLIDPEPLRAALGEIGLADPRVYLGGAAYWILVNSVLEEYVYRWFIFTRCEHLAGGSVAVVASALAFTAHHVIALQVYLSLTFTAIASLGVFVGGAVWAWCYLRYRSIWPGWISHIVADIAIFAIGWHMVFA